MNIRKIAKTVEQKFGIVFKETKYLERYEYRNKKLECYIYLGHGNWSKNKDHEFIGVGVQTSMSGVSNPCETEQEAIDTLIYELPNYGLKKQENVQLQLC